MQCLLINRHSNILYLSKQKINQLYFDDIMNRLKFVLFFVIFPLLLFNVEASKYCIPAEVVEQNGTFLIVFSEMKSMNFDNILI